MYFGGRPNVVTHTKLYVKGTRVEMTLRRTARDVYNVYIILRTIDRSAFMSGPNGIRPVDRIALLF